MFKIHRSALFNLIYQHANVITKQWAVEQGIIYFTPKFELKIQEIYAN